MPRHESDRRPGGFVVIHRRIESWPLYQAMRAAHRHVWTTLILAANWRDSEVWTRNGRLIVKRGQCLIAQRTLAQRAGATHREVRTALELLTREGAIQTTQVPTQGCRSASLITIVNYEAYQDLPTQGETSPRHDQNQLNQEATDQDRKTRSTHSPSLKEGRVIKLNPDDVLSDWDHETQSYRTRGLTAHGKSRLGRG